MSNFAVQKREPTEEEKRIKAAVLASYGSVGAEEEDEDEEGEADGDDIGANANAETVAKVVIKNVFFLCI